MRLDYLRGLNDRQRQAVTHGVEPGLLKPAPPLLILAGAGTGKTRALATRAAHLIKSGASSRRMLVLAFGNRAATEMADRVKVILPDTPLNWAGTFHSVGARLLRLYAKRAGLKPNFTIVSRSDAVDLIEMARGKAMAKSRLANSETCLAIYSRSINTQRTVMRIVRKSFPHLVESGAQLETLFGSYEKLKRKSNVADYDDLLRYWLDLVRDKTVGGKIREMFDHVLVDEFQDTNRLQAKILLELKPSGSGVTVVGDDAQSIYSFRGANVRNILRFPEQFTPPAKVLKLERNYRSTEPILAVANAVLAGAGSGKQLWSRRGSKHKPLLLNVKDGLAQARYVAEAIVQSHKAGVPYTDQAVLFREADHSLELELELSRRKIPFLKYGGSPFTDLAAVRDVTAVLRWCENPRDIIAGVRALRNIPGIGAKHANRLIASIDGNLTRSRMRGQNVPKKARKSWKAFARLVCSLGEARRWPGQVRQVSRWLRHTGSHAPSRQVVGSFQKLEILADSFATRRSFLAAMSLAATNPLDDLTGQHHDAVVLSTVHSAKGREWRHVTIINAVDGCFPSSRAGDELTLKEERRLFHVAVTRSQQQLTIVVPEELCRLTQSGGLREFVGCLSRTPFIAEQMLDLFVET